MKLKEGKAEPIQKMTVSMVQMAGQNIKNFFLVLRRGLKLKFVQ